MDQPFTLTLTAIDALGISHHVDIDMDDEVLELSRPDRRLVDLSDNVTQLTNLTMVDINCVALPRVFLGMRHVTSVRFAGPVTLSDELWRLPLEDLSVSECGMDQLPPSLAAVTTLRVLHLVGGSVQTMPSALLRSLTNLTTVILNRHRICSLGPEISHLRSLACLSLSDNCLRAIPREIGTLPLEMLLLTNNQLAFLPLELRHCSKLACLMIDGNPVAPHRQPLATGDGFGSNSIAQLNEIFAATTSLAMLREEATTLAIGLQDLELPALVTLEIIDAAFPNSIPMHKKWNLITTIKHWRRA